jgi:hypothetical protein
MKPTEDPGAFLEQLVEQEWSMIARHAWHQYQQRGRGAIVFSLRYPGEDRQEPLRYMTFTDADEAEILESSVAVMYELVREYDPETEAVVAAVLPNEHTVFDVFGREPSPVEAGE